jgi:hypothetical protein
MKLVVWDSIRNKTKQSSVDEFDIGGSSSAKGASDIVVDGTNVSFGIDVVSGDDIDVWNNGKLMDEGASDDYTIEYNTNEIIFNYVLQVGDRIKWRRY